MRAKSLFLLSFMYIYSLFILFSLTFLLKFDVFRKLYYFILPMFEVIFCFQCYFAVFFEVRTLKMFSMAVCNDRKKITVKNSYEKDN